MGGKIDFCSQMGAKIGLRLESLNLLEIESSGGGREESTRTMMKKVSAVCYQREPHCHDLTVGMIDLHHTYLMRSTIISNRSNDV